MCAVHGVYKAAERCLSLLVYNDNQGENIDVKSVPSSQMCKQSSSVTIDSKEASLKQLPLTPLAILVILKMDPVTGELLVQIYTDQIQLLLVFISDHCVLKCCYVVFICTDLFAGVVFKCKFHT